MCELKYAASFAFIVFQSPATTALVLLSVRSLLLLLLLLRIVSEHELSSTSSRRRMSRRGDRIREVLSLSSAYSLMQLPSLERELMNPILELLVPAKSNPLYHVLCEREREEEGA